MPRNFGQMSHHLRGKHHRRNRQTRLGDVLLRGTWHRCFLHFPPELRCKLFEARLLQPIAWTWSTRLFLGARPEWPKFQRPRSQAAVKNVKNTLHTNDEKMSQKKLENSGMIGLCSEAFYILLPFTPSLELAVCLHIPHALLEEEGVAVCRANSKFSTNMFDVICVGHLDFEV